MKHGVVYLSPKFLGDCRPVHRWVSLDMDESCHNEQARALDDTKLARLTS